MFSQKQKICIRIQVEILYYSILKMFGAQNSFFKPFHSYRLHKFYQLILFNIVFFLLFIDRWFSSGYNTHHPKINHFYWKSQYLIFQLDKVFDLQYLYDNCMCRRAYLLRLSLTSCCGSKNCPQTIFLFFCFFFCV